MPFQAHEQPSTHADPVLVDIDERGVAALSDGAKLQFPEGTKFTPVPYDDANTKLVMEVTAPAKGGREPVKFKIIQGATRSAVETAIRRCTLGV